MNKDTSLQKRAPESAEKLDERPTVTPAVDIFENADELLLVADLPGVGKDDLSVSFDKGKLAIFGRRSGATDGRAVSVEHRAFDYQRTFVVPQGIDAEKIGADLRGGVLRVHLPKHAALKPRQIAIRSS
jgi:HSP20 family molecular chaperone IbpA